MSRRVGFFLGLMVGVAPAVIGAEPVQLKQRGEVRAVAFAADGKTLAIGSLEAGGLRLWDFASGKAAVVIEGQKGGATFVAYSPDGKLLAAGGVDNVVTVWNVADGKAFQQLKGHEKVVVCVAFAPDGKTLATGSQDNTIRFWDVAGGKEMSQVQETDAINAVAYSADGKTLASAGWFPRIHFWEPTAAKSLRHGVGHRGAVAALAFSPDGRVLASGGEDRALRFWEVLSGKEIRQIEEHAEQINALAFSPDGKLLASAGGDRTVRLWDVATGREIRRFSEHLGPVFTLAFNPAGKLLASGASDNLVLVRDLSDMLRTPPTQPTPRTAKQLESLWKSLGNANPRQGYRAVWTLSASPRQALVLLQERLTPLAATADHQHVRQLLVELNDERTAVRDKAAQEIEKLGETIEPMLGKSLADLPQSPEARRRLEVILEKIRNNQSAGPSTEWLRARRGLIVLEGVGTPEAKQLLEKFANGIPESPLTQDARSALERLARKPPTP